MLELRGKLDLSLKALSAYACGELRRENLYRDLATQRRFLADEDAAHASAAQLALDGVGGPKGSLEVVANGHLAALKYSLLESAERDRHQRDITGHIGG